MVGSVLCLRERWAGTGAGPKEIDVRELRSELRGQGVYLQESGTRAVA
jgi:hypothetical protein